MRHPLPWRTVKPIIGGNAYYIVAANKMIVCHLFDEGTADFIVELANMKVYADGCKNTDNHAGADARKRSGLDISVGIG